MSSMKQCCPEGNGCLCGVCAYRSLVNRPEGCYVDCASCDFLVSGIIKEVTRHCKHFKRKHR